MPRHTKAALSMCHKTGNTAVATGSVDKTPTKKGDKYAQSSTVQSGWVLENTTRRDSRTLPTRNQQSSLARALSLPGASHHKLEDGRDLIIIPATQVSAWDLKQTLEAAYPGGGKYHVQVMRDKYRIKVPSFS